MILCTLNAELQRVGKMHADLICTKLRAEPACQERRQSDKAGTVAQGAGVTGWYEISCMGPRQRLATIS